MAFDPVEFAKLMGKFDAGNSNEAEAMTAMRMTRRMVVSEGLRFVDVMERADVKEALDIQLQPLRKESPQLKEAIVKIAELAEELAREKEITAELREELANGAFNAGGATTPPAVPTPVAPRVSYDGLVHGGVVAAVSIISAALMIAAAFQAVR
jgi:hypothetical protein